MKKARLQISLPLYAKILCWFFLNLVLLVLVFYGFLKVQFRLGLDSLLLGQTRDRIEAVTEVIGAELGDRGGGEWDQVLQRFSSAYKVSFLLFRANGSQAAGERLELPAEVARRLEERHPAPDLAAYGVPPGLGPDRPPGIVPPLGRGPRPLSSGFVLRTEKPTRYWVGVRLPMPTPGPRGIEPMTILAVSRSLWGGGLFVDLTPWVAVGAGLAFFSAFFWIPPVRGLTRSILQMTRATQQIAEGRFDTRVNAVRQDELGRLGGAINQMAARLKGLVDGQKRFLGDVAHELCSPLSRMQVALGILEQRADQKQQPYVADVQEEVQHMSGLVHELLCFSKASLKPATVRLQPVNLRDIAAGAVHAEAAREGKIEIDIPEELKVLGDPELLRRSLANLVRNAMRYAGQAGPITISGRSEGEFVMVTVADCGPGVPEESLGRLCDPFYRLEPSRSAETGGAGLGLAIVKTCIESCQGTVSCRNRSPSGLEVILRLKAASTR